MTRRAAWVPAAFALVFAAIVPRLADRGMFLDGVTYAAIARNLAAGEGTVWHPHYTSTVYPDFHEQPPLGLALQSLAFRVAGDHLLVERAYSCLLALVAAALIVWIWRTVHGRARTGLGWMPVVFWIAAPAVSWAFVNNMLETTQTVFTLLATGAGLNGLSARTSLTRGLWGLLSGTAIAAAVLSKGPVGLFPLAVAPAFGLAALAKQADADTPGIAGPRALVSVAVTQAVVLGLALWACWVHEPARDGLQSYFHQQLRPTLLSERETSASRFRFAKTIAQELAPMVVLTTGLLLAGRKRRRSALDVVPAPPAAGFLLLALAASLPLVLSPKQSGHYVVPSIPMFALACASMARHAGENVLAGERATRAAPWVTVALVAASVAMFAMTWGATRRDAVVLEELDRIFARVPSGTTLGLCPAAAEEWGLHAYAQRLWRASLDAGPQAHRWRLVLPSAGCASPTGCRRVVLETERLQLYECPSGATR